GCDAFSLAAEVDHLTEKEPGHTDIGNTGAALVGLSAGRSRDTDTVAEPEPLIDLRVEPELGSFPETHTRIQGDIPGLARLIRYETVLAAIGRAQRRSILPDEGRLPVQCEPVVRERRRPASQQLQDPGV